jgi:hypothetical protein
MITITIACVVTGALSCIIFASLCIRPAFRIRALVRKLESHPAMRAMIDAQDSGQAIVSAAALSEAAGRRIEAAVASIADAMVSVAGYAGQVSATATVVDSLLGLVVPRLRGMLAKDA